MSTHQIFIASYSKDFPWLVHCLRSIQKFARGYLPTVVCVDESDKSEAREIVKESGSNAWVVAFNGEGFMRAQIAMMRVDLLCPLADVVHLVGSDCIFDREFTPKVYCPNGKPAVLMNSYATLADHNSPALIWRRGVDRVLGFSPDYEYMRRLPTVIPTAILGPLRAFVEKKHGIPFDQCIIEGNKARRDTSEANIMGAFAHKFMPETCEFVNIDNVQWDGLNPAGYPSPLIQFWSHGGMDRVRDGQTDTPRQVIERVLG